MTTLVITNGDLDLTIPATASSHSVSISIMEGYPVLDRAAASDLLHPERSNSSIDEEGLHPWESSKYQMEPGFLQRPLLRIWDQFSGSLPTNDDRMIARAPEMRLDNAESRRESLALHVDHGIWTPTPYISFTTSPSRDQCLAERRQAKRGTQTLTVISPYIRIKLGLPILNMQAEMDRYGISDPYDRRGEYYADEYLCLWQVTETEIIYHWDWDDIKGNQYWYQMISLISSLRTVVFALYDLIEILGNIHGSLNADKSDARSEDRHSSDEDDETGGKCLRKLTVDLEQLQL